MQPLANPPAPDSPETKADTILTAFLDPTSTLPRAYDAIHALNPKELAVLTQKVDQEIAAREAGAPSAEIGQTSNGLRTKARALGFLGRFRRTKTPPTGIQPVPEHTLALLKDLKITLENARASIDSDALLARTDALLAETAAQRIEDQAEYEARTNAFEKKYRILDPLPTDTRCLILVGAQYEPPSKERYGIMTVDIRDTEENILAYITAHEQEAKKMKEQIRVEAKTLKKTLNEYAENAGFTIEITPDDISAYLFESSRTQIPTSSQLLQRAVDLRDALIQDGALSKTAHPAIHAGKMPMIFVGVRNRAHYSYDSYLLAVDARDPLQTNLRFLQEVAAANDTPKTAIDTMHEVERRYETDTTLSPEQAKIDTEKRDLAITLVCREMEVARFMVEEGTEYSPPTTENHGVITVQKGDTSDNIEKYIRDHAADTIKISGRAKR